MKRRNQNGFTHLVILIVVLFVAVAGFGGWWVWRNNHKSVTGSTNNNSSSSTVSSFEACKAAAGSKLQETFPEVCVTKDGKSFTGPTSSTLSSQSYLTIKEWGVKVPLSSNITDAYYQIGTSGSAYLSLDSLKSTDECAADKVSIGAYFRFLASDKDDRSGETWLSEIPSAPKVGTYYYSFMRSQSYCSDNQTIIDKETAASDAFNKAIQSVVAN